METKPLTKIDLIIKRKMMEYPRSYQSRVECWISLFTGYGTGWEWNLKTGEYEYELPQKDLPTTPRLEEIKEDDDELIKFNKQRINMNIQFIWDNIDLVVKDFHHSTIERDIHSIHSMNWYDPNTKFFSPGPMQEACIHKDKISKEWRYEISYFCNWVIGEVRRYTYSPPREDKEILTNEKILETLSKAKFRRALEIRSAFETAVNTLENIFTDEEKEQHKKNHEEIMKMADEAVKNTKKRLKEENG